ncbi:MAG: hypothetical protein M1819_000521 [Sarea resinae]|nr:MAG: hypothetical protein M1819_000521 [Sarea resinae]
MKLLRHALSAAVVSGLASSVFASEPQAPLAANTGHKKASDRPNIVFILTDDQDLQLDSLAYQPLVKKHLLDRGTFYAHHYCTIAVCCPSRVSLWTGKAAHNTNVTDVNPPYGGYPKFISQGLNEDYLPVWLQQAGYNTYYTGKLFNSHNVQNYDKPFPAGFTGSDFLLDPFTYQYLNSTFQRNQDTPRSYEGQYLTDVLASKAYGFLDDAVEDGKPFFLTVAPVAPHSNVRFSEVGDGPIKELMFQMTAPIPAKRHEHLFDDVVVPRGASFNPEEPHAVNWIRDLPRLNQTNVQYNDHFYRSRLRTLQAVDEMVEGIIERLNHHGILDNTYIIYTSDNGFHIGQHRLQPGKECGFEEDINVPLIIRGPAVLEGVTTDVVTTHTDLAPTILSLFGIEARKDFDGIAIPLTKKGLEIATQQRHEHVNVEYWGFAMGEGEYGFPGVHLNNTYKALRVVAPRYSLYYSVWCNNEHELYDLQTDPHQVNNLIPSGGQSWHATNVTILDLPLHTVVARLDSLLLVLKSCRGESCIKPWQVLHPAGDVSTLEEALDPRFDMFYGMEQTKVAFSRCEQGYILDAEGPQEALMYRDGLRWDEWV